jgi:hypothetical protein
MKKDYCKRPEVGCCEECEDFNPACGLDCKLNDAGDFEGDGVNPNYFVVKAHPQFGLGFSSVENANKFRVELGNMIDELYEKYGEREAFLGSFSGLVVRKEVSGLDF